jgi:hypothetical protein
VAACSPPRLVGPDASQARRPRALPGRALSARRSPSSSSCLMRDRSAGRPLRAGSGGGVQSQTWHAQRAPDALAAPRPSGWRGVTPPPLRRRPAHSASARAASAALCASTNAGCSARMAALRSAAAGS